MNFLHIFQAFTGDSAGLAITISAFFLVIFCIFLFGSIRRAQLAGGVWYKQNMAKYFLLPIIAFWLGALAWIWSDYRPYNPKKDGVPKVQTDSTRMSAEDIIKSQNPK